MIDQNTAPQNSPLKDRRVLVVEDEVIISFLIQDLLEELGCAAVWQASNVQGALDILKDRVPDLAVLDVNVNGELVYPVAEQLDKVRVPYIFTTGYGRAGLPEKWMNKPVLQKPYNVDVLYAALNEIFKV